MAKAPAKSRLTIWVDDAYDDHPQINDLRDKGHTIRCMRDIVKGDAPPPNLILHPVAHLWTDEMFAVKGLLDVALKAARKRKS